MNLAMESSVKSPYKKDSRIPREELILTHLPLVHYIVERMLIYTPPTLDKEDLIEAGIMGLIDAVDKFDPQRNISFATYAKFRIKGAILDQLRNLDWMPKLLRQKARELERVFLELEQKLGHPPSDETVSAALGISLEEYYRLIHQLKGIGMIYLDDLIDTTGESNTSVLDRIAYSDDEEILESVFSKELISILAKAIEQLPEREKLVISLYYFDEFTIREIGEILGLAKSTVSELHTKALLRLRAKLRHTLKKEDRCG